MKEALQPSGEGLGLTLLSVDGTSAYSCQDRPGGRTVDDRVSGRLVVAGRRQRARSEAMARTRSGDPLDGIWSPVVFQPPERRIPVSQPSKADVAPTSTAKTKATSSCTFLPPPIPSHTNSPALPDGFYQSGELPTPPPLPVELNTTNTPAVPAEPPASDQWYYCDGNQQEGPVSFDQHEILGLYGQLAARPLRVEAGDESMD